MNLDTIFDARSVAIIGAAREKSHVGHALVKSLVAGGILTAPSQKPFRGKIYPVNPYAKTIEGLRCYASVLDIKDNVDLAVIIVPSKYVERVIRECGDKGVKGIIIISAGFAEKSVEGKAKERKLLSIVNGYGMTVIGPNCLGIVRTANCLNASFAPSMPPKGGVAFVTQSGALADAAIDWSIKHEYGMSLVVSYGNAMQVDVTECIEWLNEDDDTKVITLYIEGLKDGRKFIDVCKKSKKPIVVLEADNIANRIKKEIETGQLASKAVA